MCHSGLATIVPPYAGTVKRWWAFIPYAVVGAVHLASLFSGTDAVAEPTKALLMPALLLALFVALPLRRDAVAIWAGAGVLVSWIGDLLLSTPAETGFVGGLGAFMLAHIAYLVLFLHPLKRRPIPWLALALVLWWVALLVILAPHLGVLLIPVAVYGFILGASTAAALGTNLVTAIGALLFLASDTLLAFKLFWPDFAVWQADFLIMIMYITGQGLIILGVLLQRPLPRAAEPATPEA